MTNTAVFLLASMVPADLGLPFEMLLSCKTYGDAFNSGRKNELLAACTPDFAAQWQRVPPGVFQKLPRTGSGRLLDSLRQGNGGSATVSTGKGIVTFVLLQTPAGWKVADIYRRNDDGSPLSLKGYLDATLTANEFMVKLKRLGGSTYHENLTPEFRAAFEAWPQDDVDRIREFLPDPKPQGIPVVRLGDGAATVMCRIPGGSADEIVTFHLKDQRGWKIDDFAIESRSTEIPSFRDALPVLVSSMCFGEFCRCPAQSKPEKIAAPGRLRTALEYSRTMKDSPFPPLQKPLRFAIAADALSAEMTYADRKVRICLSGDPACRGRLCDVQLKSAGSWTSVADLILLRKRVGEIASFGMWLSGAKEETPTAVASTSNRTPAEEPSVLVTAAARIGRLAEAETQPAVAREAAGREHFAEHAAAQHYVAPMSKVKRDPIRGASRRLSSAEMIRKTRDESRRRR